MAGVVEEPPVELRVRVPLGPLPELSTHEQQLLAGVSPHPGVEGTEVGPLLPVVAGHLRDERTLAVHDLVVAQRQDEVLGERVQQAEGEVVVVVLAVYRLLREVLEGVVHPAHVPLEAEPEATGIDGPRHRRPCRRLLGDHQHAGVTRMNLGVQLA